MAVVKIPTEINLNDFVDEIINDSLPNYISTVYGIDFYDDLDKNDQVKILYELANIIENMDDEILI